jgi:2-polyprenyl-3-methyl-5-hydroxy-6-metoxy-1,4-benzoquinol methylase
MMNLTEHINAQTYDKHYQDIEVINKIGYSKSHLSWNNITKLRIKWDDKIICDLGAFHSYFGIKTLQMGAKHLYACDFMDKVLESSKLILEESGYSEDDFTTTNWTGGEPTPEGDIALVLNMLHHTKDWDETLKNIRCGKAIIECHVPELVHITRFFDINQLIASHRPRRVIIEATKK